MLPSAPPGKAADGWRSDDSKIQVNQELKHDQSNSCTQSQQLLGTESKLMRIASDSLMPGFSSPNTFTFQNMSPIPVILRGAEGEVAESTLPEITLSLDVG